VKRHELKAWPVYYQAVIDGVKRAELRQDDRGFAVGDVLILREYDPEAGEYTGRWAACQVTHRITDDGPWLAPGYVCLSFVLRFDTTRQLEPSPPTSGTTHQITTWRSYYQSMLDGQRRVAFYPTDRPFHAGDHLLVKERDVVTDQITGRWGSWRVIRVETRGTRHAPAMLIVDREFSHDQPAVDPVH